MNPHELDITHTVKPSVANGRRLFKNLLTGETYWAVSCDDGKPPIPGYEKLEVFMRVSDPTVASVKTPKRGKKHKGEGDA